MANVAPPGTPRVRPSTVNIAVYLLYLLAAVQIIAAIAGVAVYSAYEDVFRATYEGQPDLEGTEGAAAAFTVGVGVAVGLIFAIVYVVLAVLNGKGNNVGRIITWVFGAISLCCMGFGLLGTAASGAMGGGGVDAEELQRNMDQLLPGWYIPLSYATSIIGILSIIAVIVLLALPASNAYFRKQPEQTWEPPLPGSTYGPPA